MSTLLKLFLGLSGVAVALALLCGVMLFGVLRVGVDEIDRLTVEDPATIAAMAGEIADFELPAEYRPDYGAHLLDFTVVAYTTGDDHSHLMLIQAPEGTNLDQLEAAARADATPDHFAPRGEVTVVDTPDVRIAGQTVRAVVGEGVNGDGLAYRQISAFFDGRGGPTLVTLTEPITRWEWTRVDAFLGSIR